MIKDCEVCKKSFRTKPYDIRRGRGKFCSKICYISDKRIKSRGEGNHQFGKHWMAGAGNPRWLGGRYKKGYSSYRQNAKKRGIEFQISLDEFVEYRNGVCEYCGSKPEVCGIDRVDSSKGYIKGNMVSCCALCNWMKKDLPLTVFIEHISKIYGKQKEVIAHGRSELQK